MIAGLGKTIISIGIVVLLFGLFQLWGTGIIEARNQDSLGNDFAELLEESQALSPNGFVSANNAKNTNNTAPVNPETLESPISPTPAPTSQTNTNLQAASTSTDVTTTPEPPPNTQPQPLANPVTDTEWLEMLYRNKGKAIARIEIPVLNVNKTVVEGVRSGDLRKGPGHYPTTPLPGQAGNSAIAGHRTTYGAPFGQIDKLKPGDEIVVTTIQGTFTYQVVPQGNGHGHFIVPPSAIEVLDQNFSTHPNRLTLTACHPRGSARQRIIVVAELLGTPAPTFAKPGQSPLQAANATPQLASENLQTATNITQPDNTQDSLQTVTPNPSTSAASPASSETPAKNPEPKSADQTRDSIAAAANISQPPSSSNNSSANIAAKDASQSEVTRTNNSSEAASFGAGLDGDSKAITPAILWTIALLAVWGAALYGGQRWRRLPAYALAALPLAVVMFMAFWHIDQVLPSY